MSDGTFAYGPGAVVCADGKELLVYEPSDESPSWKKTLDAPVACVAVSGDHVLAIDTRGVLVRCAAESGEERTRASFVGDPRAIAIGPGERYAVALDDSVVVADGEARRTVTIAGARALAFSAKLLAIGTDAGVLHVLDRGDTLAEAELGAPVRGVARHPAGFWLATAGDKVFRVEDDGTVATFTRASDRSPSEIVCSKDGALVGVLLDAKTVVALAYPSKDTLLSVTYPERDAIGLALTEDGRFAWIGMDKGDANKIDLDNEDVYRTDPHPGRARSTWLLKVSVDKAVRSKVKAARAEGRTKAPTPKPVAAPVATAAALAAEEAPRPAGPPEPVVPPSPEMHRKIVLGVLFAATALAVLSLFWK